MNHPTGFRAGRRAAVSAAAVAAALLLALASGCADLLPKPTAPPHFHTLDAQPSRPDGAAPHPDVAASPTLAVTTTRAAAGLDSRRMLYLREAHQLEYFAHNEWVATPSQMLAPLIVTALEQTGAFGAVVSAPSSVDASLQLDTEVLRLQQEFGAGPSQLHFTLRAYLLDRRTRQVLAWREFDQTVAAPSDDPRGGVAAANTVVQAVLAQLAGFCAEASRALPPPAKEL